MIDDRFEKIIEFIIKNEGGYVDHPSDPGGATKYGISFRFYKQLNPSTSKEDMEELTLQAARDIYYEEWYKKYNYHEIEDYRVAAKLLDFAVNMGPSRAHKIIQRAVNLVEKSSAITVDGIIGPITIRYINSCTAMILIDYMALLACSYYIELCNDNENNYSFIRGWINRALKETGLKFGGYDD